VSRRTANNKLNKLHRPLRKREGKGLPLQKGWSGSTTDERGYYPAGEDDISISAGDYSAHH